MTPPWPLEQGRKVPEKEGAFKEGWQATTYVREGTPFCAGPTVLMAVAPGYLP